MDVDVIHDHKQRIYGPKASLEHFKPSKGSEIFVSNLPRDSTERDIVPFFSTVGEIFKLRLIMEENSTIRNKGIAFITYTSPLAAKTAIEELNDCEIRPGRKIIVRQSVDNRELYVTNLNRELCKEEIEEEIQKLTPNLKIVNVTIFKPYQSNLEKYKNRGFAFVQYEDNRSAAIARRQITEKHMQISGVPLLVEWAEPEHREVDIDFALTNSNVDAVKQLFIRNIPLNCDNDKLKTFIENIVGQIGCVKEVKCRNDHAFVHMANGDAGKIALSKLNDTNFDGKLLKVVLAKNQAKKRESSGSIYRQVAEMFHFYRYDYDPITAGSRQSHRGKLIFDPSRFVHFLYVICQRADPLNRILPPIFYYYQETTSKLYGCECIVPIMPDPQNEYLFVRTSFIYKSKLRANIQAAILMFWRVTDFVFETLPDLVPVEFQSKIYNPQQFQQLQLKNFRPHLPVKISPPVAPTLMPYIQNYQPVQYY